MKSTYTLTWEEFAELHQSSWPRPDYFSGIVTGAVSVPLFAYGMSLAVFGMPDEPGLYSAFIGAPLLLAVTAIGSLMSQSRKVLKGAIAEKRAEYDRRNAQEESFSFDQEKWTRDTPSGKQEVVWSSLLHTLEWPNVLHVAGEGGAATVPKRVLEPAALTSLRQHAFPAAADGLPIQISWWDYQASETALLWRKYWFRLAFGNAFGLFVLGWVVDQWLSTNEKAITLWGWILASFAVLVVLAAQIWYLPLRYWTSSKPWRAVKKLSFSDRGFRLTDSYCDLFIAWRACHTFQEIGRAFLIHTSPGRYYLLSKRYLPPDSQAHLRQILQENVKRSDE